MNEAFLSILSEINLATLVVIIMLISIAFRFIKPWFNKLNTYIIDRYNKKIKGEKLSDLVYETADKMKEYEQNRIRDREQSFKIQKELTDAISEITDKLNQMCEITDKRFQESLDRENKRVRAELKDSISQRYRLYHEAGEWTTMDKEALEDLIEEYESAGGKNSFVHSKVQVEMYTWKIIDKD